MNTDRRRKLSTQRRKDAEKILDSILKTSCGFRLPLRLAVGIDLIRVYLRLSAVPFSR
jgi:hypothetical protein